MQNNTKLLGLFVAAILTNSAAASCKEMDLLRTRYEPAAAGLGAALSNLSEMTSSSSSNPQELALNMLISSNVALAVSALSNFSTLLNLKVLMKVPADSATIQSHIDSSAPSVTRILELQITSINSLIPTVRNPAFMQHAMTARDRLLDVKQLLKMQCD